jgi:hypothetical protein
MVVLLFVRSKLRRASALSRLFFVDVHGGPSLHLASGEPRAMAMIRTANNPRVLGNVLRVSGQFKLRASQPAYLQFEQGRREYVAGPGSCRQAANHKAGRRSGSFQ